MSMLRVPFRPAGSSGPVNPGCLGVLLAVGLALAAAWFFLLRDLGTTRRVTIIVPKDVELSIDGEAFRRNVAAGPQIGPTRSYGRTLEAGEHVLSFRQGEESWETIITVPDDGGMMVFQLKGRKLEQLSP